MFVMQLPGHLSLNCSQILCDDMIKLRCVLAGPRENPTHTEDGGRDVVRSDG